MKQSIHPAAQIPADVFKLLKDKLTSAQVLLLLPGGSALPAIEKLFKLLLDLAPELLQKLIISNVDERFESSLQEAGNNYGMLSSLRSFSELEGKGVQVFRIQHEGDTLEAATKRFDSFITQAIHSDVFIVGWLGVANDYHMAGILPHKEEYYPIFKRNYVTGYDIDDISMVDNPSRYRITLNFNGVMKLDEILLYAIGPEKWRVLKNFVATDSPTIKDISRNPVFILHDVKKPVKIYTDQQIY